jgi:hypothetical protein
MTKRILVCLAVAGLALSCSSAPQNSADGGGPSSNVFVAFSDNFRGYHSWKSYDVTKDAPDGGIHDGSQVTEYINKLPPSGSKEFPIGTIVVKEALGGTQTHELFAMVKRGGGFNPGAPGWEWFDLQNLNDGHDGVNIIWRGYSPPNNSTYGGDVNGTCNTCHVKCNNDAVCARPLSLANF